MATKELKDHKEMETPLCVPCVLSWLTDPSGGGYGGGAAAARIILNPAVERREPQMDTDGRRYFSERMVHLGSEFPFRRKSLFICVNLCSSAVQLPFSFFPGSWASIRILTALSRRPCLLPRGAWRPRSSPSDPCWPKRAGFRPHGLLHELADCIRPLRG